MDKFVENLFARKASPISKHTDETNKVINEAIILEQVGSYDNLNKFYDKIGKFGARDGVLFECPSMVDPCVGKTADIAAILACAKEAGSPDYDMYMKAIEVQKAYLDKMAQTFGNSAKVRIEEQKKVLDNNARVQDALAEANCCKKECSK